MIKKLMRYRGRGLCKIILKNLISSFVQEEKAFQEELLDSKLSEVRRCPYIFVSIFLVFESVPDFFLCAQENQIL